MCAARPLAEEARGPAADGRCCATAPLAAPDSWAIVTSGARAEVLAWFIGVSLPQPVSAVFGEDVSRGKPDPSCYLLAADRLGAVPTECLVVEDMPAGIAVGRSAGMTVLGIGSSHSAE
ncbi:MAG: HAD-IA family hydrolase [Mycobacterium sp.]|nr:HAD-IA family hydrolase [Mycobacterium sp.]